MTYGSECKIIKIESQEDILGSKRNPTKVTVPRRKEINRLFRTPYESLSMSDRLRISQLINLANSRINKKVYTSLAAFMWIMVAMFGKTPYCEMWGMPLAIITLALGLWIVWKQKGLAVAKPNL